MFDAIVVALDGSSEAEVAIGPAVTLASQTAARLAFVSVVSPRDEEERTDYLKGHARGTFLPSETEVRVEELVAPAIVAMTRSRAPALLCVTSHARGTLGQAAFGSTAAEVVRRLGAPVLVAGPRCMAVPVYNEVVVAVDASQESTAVLASAVALAAQLGGDLELVQVIGPDDLHAAEAAGVSSDDVLEAGHLESLVAMLAEDGVTASWEVLHNADPAAGLLDHLSEHPSAILAMATHARSGFSLLGEGSVANRVVQTSACPVLLLH